MRSRLLLLLLLGLGLALEVQAAASAALCLPAGEPSARWSDAAALGGFRVAAVDSGERVIVTAEGARWHLHAVDARGGVHDATVPVPVTAQAREDLVWLARSLLKPSGESGWGPPRTAYTPARDVAVPVAVVPVAVGALAVAPMPSTPTPSTRPPSTRPPSARPPSARPPSGPPQAAVSATDSAAGLEDAPLWVATLDVPALPVSGASPWAGAPPAAPAPPPAAPAPPPAAPAPPPVVPAPPPAAPAPPPVASPLPVAAALADTSVAPLPSSLVLRAAPQRLGLATGVGGAFGYRGDTGLGVALRLDVVADLRWLRISASGTWQPGAMLDALGPERRASQFGFGGGLGWMGTGRVRPLGMVEGGVALRRYTQANLIVADLAVPFAGVRAGVRWSLTPEVLLEPYAAVHMDLMPVTFETEGGRTAASWGAGSVGVTVLGQFGTKSRVSSEE